jgi:hypothetical protein
MEENLKKAFQKAKYEPNGELANKVWRKITVSDRRIAYFKLASFSFVSIASLVGLIPMFQILVRDFAQSGFYEYLSLAFSSGSFVSYWREFMFSLAESLPITSIIIVLAIVFIFFLSLRYMIKQIINHKYMGQSYGIA